VPKYYKHLFSPLKINNTVLKSRLSFPCAPVHFLNGPEEWPSEGYMTFYTNMAKNGCAYINMGEWNNKTQRTEGNDDSIRMQYFNTDNPALENYISQLADDVRAFGSYLCLGATGPEYPEGYSFSGGPAMGGAPGSEPKMTKMATTEMVYEAIENYAQKMLKYKKMGYGLATVSVGMGPGKKKAGGAGGPGGPGGPGGEGPGGPGGPGGGPGGPGGPGMQMGRTDEWADQDKYQKAQLQRVKEVCGKDFLLETIVAGDGMMSPEELGELSKEYEGLVDIWTLREADIASSHPTSFTFKKGEHPVIGYARRMKATGTKAIISVNGGFQDLDECDAYIANGDCDMISMGRAWFADPEYGKKAQEGRADDVTPCLWCNKCHGTMSAPWLTFCSVNPVMGNEHKLHRMFSAETTPRKVAVIGGGTAGMTAAIYAARRGHDVTLYEKTDYLGGQLYHAEVADFKWTIKDFRDWQVRQLDKLGVKVIMNCAPTPEMIEAEGFYAAIACTGAVPNVPKFAQDENGKLKAGLTTCVDVFKNGEDKLGKKVVIVGGSETGIETAMYLGQAGHDVTVLTRQNEVAHDAPKLHYITMSWVDPTAPGFMGVKPEWEKPKYNGIKSVVEVTTKAVTANSVTYCDKDGNETTIECDSVVICGGMVPCQEEAIQYADSVNFFYMAGDCEAIGNIQKCTRSGYSKAMQI